MCIGTGLPCSCAGSYFQRLSASFAASCKIAGPETTFMLATCPLASIRASIVTAPVIRWVFAIAGYRGGTEEIKAADFISGALLGATGCLEEEPTRPDA